MSWSRGSRKNDLSKRLEGVDAGRVVHLAVEAKASDRYPDAVGTIVNQHGFNLAWIGLTTIVGGVLVWRGSKVAMLVSALVGGLADVGYFIFIDLGGYARFVPGTVMTLVSATAVALSAYAYVRAARSAGQSGRDVSF